MNFCKNIEVSELVVSRQVFFDTIRVYFPRYLKIDEYKVIRSLCKSFIRLKQMEKQPYWKSGLALTKPEDELIKFLADTFPVHIITRVDCALDLITHTRRDAERVQDYLDAHQIKRWHKNQRIGRSKGTAYSSANPKVSTNLVRYSDKPSKMNELPCCHVEWRMLTTPVLRRAKINGLADLLDFDHRGFWQPKLVLLHAPELEKVGKLFFGQPKRQKPWLLPYGKHSVIDMFARAGNMLLRASRDKYSEITAQEALDYLGSGYKSYFAKIPTEWMLPAND